MAVLVEAGSKSICPVPPKKSILGKPLATDSIRPLEFTLVAVVALVKSKSPVEVLGLILCILTSLTAVGVNNIDAESRRLLSLNSFNTV